MVVRGTNADENEGESGDEREGGVWGERSEGANERNASLGERDFGDGGNRLRSFYVVVRRVSNA